ncbi:MAG TPA: tetratricopeptide repeat protein, partial [Alistipes onderdonkii]|nr:tetratricopeptide repeat protein [Alistipes onderdonkii]
HPADDAYLRDIEGERPSVQAQARELWLQTENLWVLWPGFIAALRAAQ